MIYFEILYPNYSEIFVARTYYNYYKNIIFEVEIEKEKMCLQKFVLF